MPSANGRQHIRVAVSRAGGSDQARRVFEALFPIPYVKHVFVVDDDVDVFSDEQVEWAMATRFRADTDLVVRNGCKPFYMEPMIAEDGTMTKAGFDLTEPCGKPDTVGNWLAIAPRLKRAPRYQNVRQALEGGPMFFSQLMEALGSDDGREISLELHELREEGVLDRLENGEWTLKGDARE